MFRFVRLGGLFVASVTILFLCAGCSGGGGGTAAPVINTTSATTGQPISVDLSRSTLSVNKTTAVANGSDQIVATLTARDSNGEPVAGFAFTVQATGSQNTLTQPAPTDSNGVTQAVLVSTRAEGKSVTASLNGTALGSSATVTFIPGPPAKLSLRVPPPSEVQLGALMPAVRVAVEDLFGNLVTDLGSGSTVMTVSAAPVPSELSGTLSHSVVDGFAEFSGLSFTQLGSGRVLTFELRGITASSSSINVVSTPAATNKLVFVASPTDTVTAAENNLGEVVVRLKNENDIELHQSGVPITLAVSTGPGALQGTTTVDTDSDGVAGFTGLSLETAGTYKLTATSSSQDFPNSVTSPEFTVVADSSKPGLRFSTQPSNSLIIDDDFAVQVEAVDPFGNRITSFASGVSLSLQNTSSVPSGITLTPSASLDQTASQGIADYSGLAVTGNFETTETGYFLRATSSAGGGLRMDSGQFSLVGGAPAALSIVNKSPMPTVQPADPFEGNAFALTVRVLDQHGNFSPTATDTVTVALDDSGATPTGVRGMSQLSGTLSRAAAGGSASFDDLKLSKTGSNFVLTASAPGLTSDSTNPFTVSLSAGPRTLVVDNVNGKSPAEGGNGLPGCPFATIDQALAEAESDANVNIIEVVETGVDYPGDVDLAAPALIQSLTLRGRAGGRPTLTGQVTLNGEDMVQSLNIVRNAADEALLGELSGGGGADGVHVTNNAGPGIRLSITEGGGRLSEIQVDSLSTGVKLTAVAGAAWTFQLSTINTSAGSGLEVAGGNFGALLNEIYAVGGPALIASNIGLLYTADDFGPLSSINSPSTGVSLTNVSSGSFYCKTIYVSECQNSGLVVADSALDVNAVSCTVNSAVMASGSRAFDLSTHSGEFKSARLNCSVNQSGLFTGGGSLDLTLPGGGNLTAGGGPALTCQGTMFGPSDAEFGSISSQGGSNGIYLANTTGKALIVAGNDSPGSGGTLQSISGNAVELVNCSNVTLKNMNIGAAGDLSNIGGNGVDGTSSGTVSIQNCNFLNVGGDALAEGAVWVVDPTGPWDVIGCSFERSYREHLGVRNNNPTSTPPKILAQGCSFKDTESSPAGEEAIFYYGNPGSSGEVEIKSCTFEDSKTDHIRVSNAAGSSVTATIGGPTVSDGNQFQTLTGPTTGRDGATLDSNGIMTYLVQNNTANNAAVAFRASASTVGVMNGSFLDNNVGTDSASSSVIGISCLSSDSSTLTFEVRGNTVRRTSAGCQVQSRDGSKCEGTIVSNDLASLSDPISNNGLNIYAGRLSGSGETATTCVDVRDNLLQSTLSSDLYYFVGVGCTLQLPEYSGPATGATAVTAVTDYFIARNPGLAQVTGTVDGTATVCP